MRLYAISLFDHNATLSKDLKEANAAAAEQEDKISSAQNKELERNQFGLMLLRATDRMQAHAYDVLSSEKDAKHQTTKSWDATLEHVAAYAHMLRGMGMGIEEIWVFNWDVEWRNHQGPYALTNVGHTAMREFLDPTEDREEGSKSEDSSGSEGASEVESQDDDERVAESRTLSGDEGENETGAADGDITGETQVVPETQDF